MRFAAFLNAGYLGEESRISRFTQVVKKSGVWADGGDKKENHSTISPCSLAFHTLSLFQSRYCEQ
jgi:hypothetical protein